MKLAQILKKDSKNMSSVEECLELLNKIKSSKVKINTYTQERKPFSSEEIPLFYCILTRMITTGCYNTQKKLK